MQNNALTGERLFTSRDLTRLIIPLIIEHLDEGDIERAKRFTDDTLKRAGV